MNPNQPPAKTWKVPRGATGFWDSRRGALAEIDHRPFKALCFMAAWRVDGRVERFEPPTATATFCSATISFGQYQKRAISVLCHRYVPLLALTDHAPVPLMPVVPADHPDIRAALAADTTFRVLTTDELKTPVAMADLSGLAKAELDQIAYWKPERVADLLFSYWD